MNNKNIQQTKAKYKLFFIGMALLAGSLSTTAQTNVAIAPNKMNVLYIGVDNPVSIAASGGSDEKVTVSINGGEGVVSKTGSGLYNVRVAAVTDECLMNVYVEGKLAGSSKFRVRNLPVPLATVGGYTSGNKITADAFKKQAGVGVYLKDFPFDVKYEVVSFTFSVEDDKGEVKSADCEGATFSPLAKQYIDQFVKPERTVTISNILATDPAGRKLKLPALLFTIK